MSEVWELVDGQKRKTGILHERIHSDLIPKGLFHIVVEIWTKLPDGTLLLTRRSPQKPMGLLWECTMGSVLVGEESRDGAVRELAEETGIRAEKADLKLVNTVVYSNYIMDVYLYECDIDITEVVLQEDEVCGAKLATEAEILTMIENDEFVERVWKRFAEVK